MGPRIGGSTPRRSTCEVGTSGFARGHLANPADKRYRGGYDEVAHGRMQASAGRMREFGPAAASASLASPSLIITKIGWNFVIERSWEHGFVSEVRQRGANDESRIR